MQANCVLPVVLYAIFSQAKSQEPSPCPHLFTYEDNDVRTGRWYGIVSLVTFEDLNGVWVQVELDRAAEELTSKFGETTALNSKEYLIADEDFKLQSQKVLTIKISVKYDLDVIPSVIRIRLNGHLICGNSSEQASCGIISNTGRWPWSVAILQFGDDETLKYRCGGVLISDWHILTTGQCVTKLEAEDLLLYLGTDRLRKHGPGFQIAQVAEIYTHPDYRFATVSDDLAVLKLARSVERNGYVAPVCFPGEEDIIGKSATLISRGRNVVNKSVLYQELKIPVVSPGESCVNFDRKFYSQFTSPKTFCGGYTNGTFACLGSSGSGLVFPSSDGLHWQLHGIAAFAKPSNSQIRNGCESEGYVIFMNVTSYVDWLKEVIELR